jgi:hypothetical protein
MNNFISLAKIMDAFAQTETPLPIIGCIYSFFLCSALFSFISEEIPLVGTRTHPCETSRYKHLLKLTILEL